MPPGTILLAPNEFTPLGYSLRHIPRLAVNPETVYRLFYPHVPVIVCAKSNQISAMPAASAVSISHSPPMVAVSVKRKLTTNLVIRRSSTFSLNWVDFKKRRLINKLAEPRKKKTKDKLKSLDIPYYVVLGSPILEEAVAYAIVKKERMITTGDHDLFIGTVHGAMASLDFDEYWKFRAYKPPLYVGSEKRASFVSI